MAVDTHYIIQEYLEFIGGKAFPCIGAKTALAKNQVSCFVAGNMACPVHDRAILDFLYGFVDQYRLDGGNFHSAAILFDGPGNITEEMFEQLLWKKLQSISDLDAANYKYDARVDADPAAAGFSFSLKEEAFFIIGMHPSSSRAARRFKYPALIFNPHAQFEAMKQTNKYEMMKQSVRKRDIAFSGSVNPMLSDHGKTSEIIQYSGKTYHTPLQCPLMIKHATT